MTRLCNICKNAVMRLREYLVAEKMTASQFAVRIERSVSTVTRAARGEVLPDRDTMRRIVEETDGAVRPNDFHDFDPTPGGVRAELQKAG